MDEGEIKKPKEVIPSRSRPRLYYHGTFGNQVASLLSEYGLLAHKATLTPFLEIAQDYLIDRGLLTFWYPKRNEIEKPAHSATEPTKSFPENIRQEAIEEIQKRDWDPTVKQWILKNVKYAKTYLPPSRLGAIAVTTDRDVGALSNYLRQLDSLILSDYADHHEELVQEVVENLDSMQITYFDPRLNNRTLAEDMARTTVEHYMLSIGEKIQFTRKYDQSLSQQYLPVIKNHLSSFQSVKFKEPSLERYRKMLVSMMAKLVSA